MRITILTLFPEMLKGTVESSILKRAQSSELHTQPPLEIEIVNIRDFTTDKHKTADDRPYGGGAGMVMKIEPIHKALLSLKIPNSKFQIPKQTNQPTNKLANQLTILTSAKGKLFTQQTAQEYSKLDHLIIICGHYEGVDQRVSDHLIDEEVRIGDYVLTGGEPAAVVITDAVARLIPGVLGNEESPTHESHSEPGYLEHPQYTRPEEYNGWKVPEVLLQGNHKEIEEWRQKQSKKTNVIPAIGNNLKS